MQLGATAAKALIRRLLEHGSFVLLPHARTEMSKDGLTAVDAVNVLRGGVVREPEWENGAWRYRVETPRMVFVVELDPEPESAKPDDDEVARMELVVVTA